MIVKRFLLWVRLASAEQRARAVAGLAGAYLYSDLTEQDRYEAEAALTSMLDDPSPLIRRALAEAMASAVDAPRPIIIGLVNDRSDIAAIVLQRSPVLSTSDLVDSAAVGDAVVQTAIAQRPELSSPVAAALAEVGAPSALAALARNGSAQIAAFSLRRMYQRWGAEPAVREALRDRADLPADVRQSIVAFVAAALSSFVVDCRWMTPERSARAAREATERATLVIADDLPDASVELVRHLRDTAQLTPALILRALLGGQMRMVEAALAELAELDIRRVAGFLTAEGGAGFVAIYRKAGLPTALLPAFLAALASRGNDRAITGRMCRQTIARVIRACEGAESPELTSLLALLRRFEADAAREEARAITDALGDEAALRLLIENDPEALVIDNADKTSMAA